MAQESWRKPPEGKWPESLSECFDQGREDFLAGYKITWTPNLGPMTRIPSAMKQWREGWMFQRDEVILKWEEEAAHEQGRTEDP